MQHDRLAPVPLTVTLAQKLRLQPRRLGREAEHVFAMVLGFRGAAFGFLEGRTQADVLVVGGTEPDRVGVVPDHPGARLRPTQPVVERTRRQAERPGSRQLGRMLCRGHNGRRALFVGQRNCRHALPDPR